jgi:cell division topological specificity factor
MATLWDKIFGRRNETISAAAAAKQRLQLVLVTDRSDLSPEKLQQMKDEIIAVISKYVKIANDKVEINLEQRQRDNWLVADIPLLKGLSANETGVDDA